MGRYGGQLKDVRPDDLAAIVLKEACERAHVKPAEVEDVILGCANQAGEDNRNVARMALLLAGFPVEVPGQTVNRLCGSGMQATIAAARDIVGSARQAEARLRGKRFSDCRQRVAAERRSDRAGSDVGLEGEGARLAAARAPGFGSARGRASRLHGDRACALDSEGAREGGPAAR